MGDHEHGHPLVGQLTHNAEHIADHFGVKGAGGLIKQHQLGIHGERPGDSHTLLLPARELTRQAVFLTGKPHLRQLLARHLLSGCLAAPQHLHLRYGAVIEYAQVPEQVELLEHHTHAGAHRVNIHIRVGDFSMAYGDGSALRFFKQVHAPQQSRFA